MEHFPSSCWSWCSLLKAVLLKVSECNQAVLLLEAVLDKCGPTFINEDLRLSCWSINSVIFCYELRIRYRRACLPLGSNASYFYIMKDVLCHSRCQRELQIDLHAVFIRSVHVKIGPCSRTWTLDTSDLHKHLIWHWLSQCFAKLLKFNISFFELSHKGSGYHQSAKHILEPLTNLSMLHDWICYCYFFMILLIAVFCVLSDRAHNV